MSQIKTFESAINVGLIETKKEKSDATNLPSFSFRTR